jgi:two-component system nitrogen regulation sensor histidine kinase NtrY
MVNAQRQLAWRDVARRIAHEIRNPLTPIQLSTERLRRRYRSEIPETDQIFDRCVDTILRQVGDIDRMVQEFSSFARMPKPSVAEFDLRSLLENAAFSQNMTTPDITVNVMSRDLPDGLFYKGDERLLAQAFGNLLKNAAESISGLPEELEVKGSIEVLIEEGVEGTWITIEDNGRGFPESAREKLLEPYVTTREKGTGLGLAIVNRIIMDHGGSISLQNRSDGLRGARVRVLLPLAEADLSGAVNQPPVKVEEPAYGK